MGDGKDEGGNGSGTPKGVPPKPPPKRPSEATGSAPEARTPAVLDSIWGNDEPTTVGEPEQPRANTMPAGTPSPAARPSSAPAPATVAAFTSDGGRTPVPAASAAGESQPASGVAPAQPPRVPGSNPGGKAPPPPPTRAQTMAGRADPAAAASLLVAPAGRAASSAGDARGAATGARTLMGPPKGGAAAAPVPIVNSPKITTATRKPQHTPAGGFQSQPPPGDELRGLPGRSSEGRRGAQRAAPVEAPTVARELRLRFERLQAGDPVGAARSLVELGLYEERVNHDRIAARKNYETARSLVRGLQPALTRLRRLLDSKAELAHALSVIDDELAAAEDEPGRADLLAERARICEALGRTADARGSYGEALGANPLHAASLRGLEAVLRKDLAKSADGALAVPLAVHLERLADAYAPSTARADGDGRLAAWIHVERAEVLDHRLQQAEFAKAALDRAVSFDASPGPVRDALGRHLIRHKQVNAYVAALSVEADHERDDDRAARLLYTAARCIIDKLQAPTDAIGVLSRAAARAPTRSPSERRILAELVRLLEGSGELAAAAEVRHRQLGLLVDAARGGGIQVPEVIVHEHVRLSELFDALGQPDRAASYAQQALDIDPEDSATRERLDRAYQRLGRHEDRVKAWLGEANARRPTTGGGNAPGSTPGHASASARVAAFLRAADIAERHLKRRDDAVTYLRAAWSIEPGNSDVFDALSALLTPAARDPEADSRGVRARLDLYTQAVAASREPARKVGLLEKLVAIWEDELCQPARAIEQIERILEIEPTRRTAILALSRNAERAGDAKSLARALAAEASLTSDVALQRRLLLRAGEVLAERVGDRERALQKMEKALALDPTDPDALRALVRMHERTGRHAEARKALLQLIAREPGGTSAFNLWVEVALLDEHRLKRPVDAVNAYRQAARIKPRHPLPPTEIVRLLRETGDYLKLVESLTALAADAADPVEYARLLFQAAEVQELALGNDESALKSLAQADAALTTARRQAAASGTADEPEQSLPEDFGVLEAMERIYVRHAARAELVTLYGRWLERQPPATVDHGVRIALASVLAQTGQPKQAVELLEALVGVVPTHVPALRMLEQLHRELGADPGLATVLRAEADVLSSQVARCGALWELASLEERVGGGATLDALVRIVADSPRDIAAHDAIVRIASKLTEGVNIPHPAALATRVRLVAAVHARKELTRDPVARACYQLEEAMLHEGQAGDDASALHTGLTGFAAALSLWPESMLAARGVERLASRLGDRASLLTSQLSLAKLVQQTELRAGHMVRAAELYAEDPSPNSQLQALALYEEALRTDPDNPNAVAALARMLASDPPRLVDRLGAALDRATVGDQIVVLGSELGRAVLRQKESRVGGAIDPGIGITAMTRVLAEQPNDVPALMVMSRLLSMQQLWPEARDMLLRVVEVAPDPQARLNAQFDLAGIYEGPLGDLAAAHATLESVLALDPKNRRALERLHQVAIARGDRALVISVLARLADGESDPATRAEYDLRLADACRDAGDNAGMVRALADAIVSAPQDLRAWSGLARLYRAETTDGASAYVVALKQVLDIAGARRMPLDPRWLSTLGLLETTVLKRAVDGLAHLQQAAALPNAPPDARVALGQGLVACGRNAEAAQVLRELMTVDAEAFARIADISAPLVALESALATDGRAEERLAVEEVRACLGDVKTERLAWLRARRLPAEVPYPMGLAGSELGRLLLPEARTPLIDVSVAIAPIAAKALRFELASLGVSSRDRIGARDGHPTRMLAERIARAVGVEAFEFYLSASWQGAARVYPGDPPAIVGPANFPELPEPEQIFALGRLLTRIALGITWLDELSPEALDGLLLASMRMVDPQFGVGEITPGRDHSAQNFIAPMQKAIGRRQRKLLEDLIPTTSPAYDVRAFTIGVRRSEYRTAYVLAGDLVAAIDYLRRFDREIGRASESPRVLLKHPVTNELLRYAMTTDAHSERRRLGTVWMGG